MTTPVIAKSLVIDILSNHSGGWGNGSTGYSTTQGAFRRVLFRLGGQLIDIETIDALEYASYLSAFNPMNYLYLLTNSSYSNTGQNSISLSESGSFNSIYGDSPQRIVIVFANVQTFDEIVIHNYHYSGNYTARGMKDVKIHSTMLELTQEDADDVLGTVDGYLLFEDAIAEHVNADMDDPQYISVETPTLVTVHGDYGEYVGEIDAETSISVQVQDDYAEYGGQIRVETTAVVQVQGDYAEYGGQVNCMSGERDSVVSGNYGEYGGQITIDTESVLQVTGVYGEYTGQLQLVNASLPACSLPVFNDTRFC